MPGCHSCGTRRSQNQSHAGTELAQRLKTAAQGAHWWCGNEGATRGTGWRRRCALDLFIVRKLGVPGGAAMGAVLPAVSRVFGDGGQLSHTGRRSHGQEQGALGPRAPGAVPKHTGSGEEDSGE